MRIGIDARLWNETGVGRYTRALVSKLQELDETNEYILFLIREDFEKLNLKKNNWRKVVADIQWHTFSEQIHLPGIIAKEKLDLLHLPYFSVPVLNTTPFIVTIHDLTISHFATGKATTKSWPEYQIKRLGYQIILRSAVTKAQRIITVSKTVKKDIENLFKLNPAKVIVTYESGELEKNIERIESRIQLPREFILYVGNAHPHKNLDNLVRSFQLMNNKFPHLKLVFVGKYDYFYRRLQKKVIDMNISDSVIFLGVISNNQLYEIYKKARCLVFPSYSEGFGIPGLEAMTCKCPVVASDIDVFREVYKTGAVYFSAVDIKDMAQKIEQVLVNQTLRENLITKGKKIAAHYSWRKMAQETLEIYENCSRLRSNQ